MGTRDKVLNKKTSVSLTLVISCIVTAVALTLWLSDRLHRIDLRLMKIEAVLKISGVTGPAGIAKSK